jgi:hypothetical protein
MKGYPMLDPKRQFPTSSEFPDMPSRYWSAVDFNLMTLEEAKAAWAFEKSQLPQETNLDK